jgi:hypothetical protein
MFPIRRIEYFEDEGPNVFVPGLMAAGILLSIVMLAADAAKWLWPSRGERARGARIAHKLQGRINDLESVALGTAPKPFRVKREPRGVVVSIALAIASFAATHEIFFATIRVYGARTGSLAQRGWTLSGGFFFASVCASIGVLAMLNVISPAGRRPRWLASVNSNWLLGRIPRVEDPEEV